jgi:glycosyltransferase involved in cell wall biosynthesis
MIRGPGGARVREAVDPIVIPQDYVTAVAERSQHLFGLTADIIMGTLVASSRDGATARTDGRYAIIGQTEHTAREPQVSVVIPTFNRPDLLVQAVDSVCRQDDVDLELVIVDDAGADIPAETFARLLRQRWPITVVRHRRNLGLGASRNTGVSLAHGSWITMLDDDDALVQGSIVQLLDAARAAREAQFVFGDHLRQGYDGDRPTDLEHRRGGIGALRDLFTENPIMCGSFIIQRRAFVALRGYREDLPVHEDYNLHLRLLSAIDPVYVSTPVCIYHCRETLPRLNHKRLYWFATSAFNHAVYRALFHRTGDRALKVAQRENQYAHLARSLDEGCPRDVALSLVHLWRHTLRARGLSEEIDIDEAAMVGACPSIR